MTDNTEREWPTFGDILNELNTLGHLSQVSPSADTIAEPMAAQPVTTAAVTPQPVITPEPVAAAPVDTFDTSVAAITPTAPAIDHDIVVPILPPSSLDTSLLAGPSSDSAEATLDTSALEPLAPAPDVDALVESADVLPIVDTEADAGSVFDAPALSDVADVAPMSFDPVEIEPVEIETPELLDPAAFENAAPVEPLTFEAPAAAFEPMTFEPVEIETPELLDPMAFENAAPVEPAPLETPGFEPMVFDTPDFAAEEVSMDWAETALEQDPPFTGEAPGSVIAFDPAGADLTPAPEAMAPVAPAEEFTSTDWSTGAEPSSGDTPAEDGDFDSVATADAIESDLQDLFALDQSVSEDNFGAFMGDAPAEAMDDAPVADVVPLHPPTEENEEVFGLDAVFDPAAPVQEDPIQPWVGVQHEDEEHEDPWAYMRPDEAEDVKGGFWANRPKFFGGNERKAKKAARQQAAAASEMRTDENGPICPNCNEIGQVDLDDPVGGKIHASCQSCGHVWSQASDAAMQSESA